MNSNEESSADVAVEAAADKPVKKPRRAPRKKKQEDTVDEASTAISEAEETPKPKAAAKKPRRAPRKKASTKEDAAVPDSPSTQEPPVEAIQSDNFETKSAETEVSDGEKRSGWWRR